MERPRYTTSKVAMWVSGGCAWLMMFLVVVGAFLERAECVAIAPTVIPSMVLLIVSLLGVHRAFGSIDMRAALSAPRRHRRPPAAPPDLAPADEEPR